MNTLKKVIGIGLALAIPFALGAEQGQKAAGEEGSAGSAVEKTAPAGNTGQGAGQSTASSTGSVQMPVYKPPLRGSPGGRVGGGTRGLPGKESVYIQVLAPDHVGLTTQDQPRLYWYISGPAASPIEFSISERGDVKPILEKRLASPGMPGIQSIRLADYGIRLKAKTPYKWFVSIVIDPDRRSKDIVAGGVVEYVQLTPSLSEKISQAGKDSKLSVLAGEGLWYDALAFISDSVDASPNDASLRNQRASLLEQVGLKEVAESEMQYTAPAKTK